MAAVFLTGGTGFVGSRVCRALQRREHAVSFLTRSRGTAPPGVEPVRADLLEPAGYRDALRRADVVVHLAALTGKSPERDHFRVNAEGTEALVEECRRAGVGRLLFTSTIAVRFPDTRSYAYARAKTRAEEAIRASGRRFTIVRPTIVLGPGSPTQAGLERLALLPVVPVFGDGRARVQPIYVDDLVEFLVALIEQDRFYGETLELGGPTVLTIEELLRTIREARRGTRGPLVHVPLGLALAMLNAAAAIGLAGLLPVSAGQLSSFRYDGTSESNALYESRRASLADLRRMIA